jgi:hypothetical protein
LDLEKGVREMAHINHERIGKVAKIFREMPDTENGLNFYSILRDGKDIPLLDMYPNIRHFGAVDFFFFVALHNYGYWYGSPKGYASPLYGVWKGQKVKGSDLLYKMLMRALEDNPHVFLPERLARITEKELSRIFSDDNGFVPLFETNARLERTRAYGEWFLENFTAPRDLLDDANGDEYPLRHFLSELRLIPGFDRDPLQKRNLLLAMSLANRPERFLRVTDDEHWKPVVDYHLMRLALRLGLVELNETETWRNEERRWVTAREEHSIRIATYEAVKLLIRASGRSMFFIDEKMWTARKYCPETTKPDCEKCIFANVCGKRINLFQPVYRTTAY